MPAIRQLCNKVGALAAPHHIFAGVSSVLAAGKQQSTVQIQALIVAVYILVITRLSGTKTAPDEYQNRRNIALEIVKGTCRNDEVEAEVGNADIDDFMREFKDQKWTLMDWFQNITPGGGVGLNKRAEDDLRDDSDNDEAEEGGLLPVTGRTIGSRASPEQDYLQAGLGTMVKTSLCCSVIYSANVSADARSGRLPQ